MWIQVIDEIARYVKIVKSALYFSFQESAAALFASSNNPNALDYC
jgi:hypothetical protein